MDGKRLPPCLSSVVRLTLARSPTPGSAALPASTVAPTLPPLQVAPLGAAEANHVLRPPNVYVLDRKEQEDKLARLAEVEVKDDGWTRYFADPETDERWTLYHPRSEKHGGGPRFLRRGDIPNDVAGWAVALLRNGTEADVVGAGTDLSAEPEVWAAVLDRIEAEREALRSNLVREFLNHLGVLQPVNRRPIVGKPGAEVASDAAHFQELADRAAALTGP